jgi:glycine cleavage system H protein
MSTETNENFWTKIDGETATVGISDYTQKMLGEISFVQLPEIGKTVKAGEEIGIIESLKAISPLVCPLDGKISEVNAILEKKPEIINESPLEKGWIWKMKILKSE